MNLKKKYLAAIIMFIAIICQCCTSMNADNKTTDNKNCRDSSKVKKDSISKEYLLGKIVPTKDTNFITVDLKYASRKGLYMHKEAYNSFRKMFDAALKDGVKLIILSATRTFKEQKVIWEGKWTGKASYYGKNIATAYPDPVERSKYVLKYSSMPGTSRHHWGTDIDMNSMELSYYNSETGKKTYSWLTENAAKYGFCQPYTAKGSERATGYEEEKWHWSYFPLSSLYLQQYQERITYNDLKGFAGCETAKQIEIIKNYVLEVNKKCQ
jgi:LAS superfamily LD-carboxypeptidase LdcB